MRPADIIAIAVILLIVGAASFYIIKAKKNGRKCIGCPDGASCKSNKNSGCGCGSCGGSCSSCNGEKSEK